LRRRAWLLPLLSVVLGPTILFAPMLLRGETLFWGTPLLQFTPWRVFALEALRGGDLPLWNPLLGMGAPLIANYQSALFYPPNWLLAVFDPAWGQGLLVLLHLIWAGLGMARLARALELSPLAQAVSGVAFSLSGYLVARSGFLSINAAVSWVPWVIGSADRLADMSASPGRTRLALRHAAVLAVTLAMQWLAGHAQTAWYTLILAVIWSGWRGWTRRRGSGAVRAWAGLAAAGALGFVLAAVQLLPTLEYLGQSQRATAVDPQLALTYSFWPWRLLGLLMPRLFGSPASGDYWGYGNFWEDAIYIGVIPVCLAISAAFRKGRSQRPADAVKGVLLVVSAVSFLLALGQNTPVYPFLFRRVPTFSLFQAPTRWTLLLMFSLSLLAGFGVEGLRPLSNRGRYWSRLSLVGALTVAAIALLTGRLLTGLNPTFSPAFALMGIGLATYLLLRLRWKADVSPGWSAMVMGLVVLDLVHAGWGLNPSQPVSLFQGSSRLADRVGDGHRLYMPERLEYELKFEKTHRFSTFDPGIAWLSVRQAGLPNTTILDGLPSANNFDPLLPGRYAAWIEALEELPAAQRTSLFALMDVGWLAQGDGQGPLGVGYVQVPQARRVRLVPQAQWVAGPEGALRLVLAADFDPEARVILEGNPSETVEASGRLGEAEILPESNPNRVRVEARAEASAWVVLSDAWYPGWRAFVDGVQVDLYPADYLFRAVRVPKGAHRVEFVYRPLLFGVGVAASAAGWLVLAGLFVWMKRSEKREQGKSVQPT